MIDVNHQISAVRRQVGKRTLEAGEARVVTVSQIYPSPPEDVWDACTNPSRIQRWFLPVSGELRLGGRYQLQGHAGGLVERCDPPSAFMATWEFGGSVTWIELRLTPEGDGTRFALDHIIPVDDDKQWAEFGPGAVGLGWDSIVAGIARHLASPAFRVDQAAAMAWMFSDEGKAFMTAASEDWYRANVSAGEDPSVARAMADASTAAYTTPPA